MEKLKMQTKNKIDANIEILGKLFPNILTESINGYDDKNNPIIKKVLDFDILKQELSEFLVDGNEERYQMNWPGKKESILKANAPINKTLRPYKDESVNFDKTENLYIEGDNLEVLKLLQETYLNKIKMIYIDPPYNTGNDKFIYNDNFEMSYEEFKEISNQYDDENIYYDIRKNNESNGRFHTDWLNMMYPRLKLSKDLLTDDGAIFISIDANEVDNLKKICNEIFGEKNFINIITCKTKIAGVSGSNIGKSLQDNTEYCLVYSKNINEFLILNTPYKKQELMDYIKTMKVMNKSWKYTSVIKNLDKGKLIKETKDGSGGLIKIFKHNQYDIVSINEIAKNEFNGDLSKAYYKYIDKIFRTTNAQSSIRTRIINECNNINSDFISIEYVPRKGKKAGTTVTLYYKDKVRNLVTFLSDVVEKDGNKIFKLDNKGNLWDDIQYNNLTKEGNVKYPNGKKPLQMLNDITKMLTKNNDIILDFFSGSSSLAHSVMECNAEDFNKRKFIMIQLPEKILPESKEKVDYLEYLKNENIPPIITEIGKERIKRAGKKIKKDNADKTETLDTGFRVLKVDYSNMKDVFYNPSEYNQNLLDNLENNIKDGRSDEDLLFQVMLELGVLLSSNIKELKIDDKRVFNVGQNEIIACFDNKISDEVVKSIAKMKPTYAIFRDSSLLNDSVATNFEQIFKTYSPNTIRKVL